jgi:Protein of unknown function (DUF3224)
MIRAKGTFEVKIEPLADPGPSIGRMSIDKQFHGDLEATSKGQMLSSMSSVKGSAGYVAMEHVIGTLSGRHGSFVLQHNGTMDRGKPHLTVTVVPDSGTDQLTGISGSLTIEIVDGKHFYVFEYAIAEKE